MSDWKDPDVASAIARAVPESDIVGSLRLWASKFAKEGAPPELVADLADAADLLDGLYGRKAS